jgi:serine/threonine protein kinase/Tol biopolymer transport system component
MTPERWRQIEQLFQSALERAPEHRNAFLDQACGQDADLRERVEHLLGQRTSSAALYDQSLWESAADQMTRTIVTPGTQLGPYKVIGLLGEGGMGKVYRGLDTRLDRPVAIKLSVEQFEQRFEREARAISMLNHPHICTLYDVGPNFIVTELVEGETLSAWLNRSPAEDRVVEVARQVLEALRAAHGAGIVHRDLKPANIMVRFDGYVKVLDFGLAKRVTASPVGSAEGTPGPEITAPGQIAGTAAYMSPEQIQGEEVDQRSDLFSFGIVFYQLLTGNHPWARKSTIDTLHAILHDDPAPIGNTSAPNLNAIVLKLLRKDPKERYASADAVLADLSGDRKLPSSGGRPTISQPRLWPLFAAALAIALLAVAYWFWPRDTSLRVGELIRITSDAGLTAEPALAPDGKMVAYASDRDEGPLNIWVQQVSGGAPIQVTHDAVDDSEPSFSPAGTTIAFHSTRDGGGVYVVPSLGGTPRRIAGQGRRPRFSPDGQWLAYWVGEEGVFSRNKVYIVPAQGGQPRQLASTFLSAFYPVWSPDSKYLLFLGAESDTKPVNDRYDWWVASLGGSPPVATGILSAMAHNNVFPEFRAPSAWVGNSILFSGSTQSYAGNTLTGVISQLSIWRQRISSQPWRPNGRPEQLTTVAGIETDPSISAGKLALANTRENLDVWMLPLNAETGQVTGPIEHALSSTANNNYPAVSRDGSRLTFVTDEHKSLDIYEKDLRTGRISALTTGDLTALSPFPNADGTQVLFYVFRSQMRPTFTFWQVTSQGGNARQVCGDCDGSLYYWSRDEKKVIYYKDQPVASRGLVVRDLQSAQEFPFATHEKYEVRLPRVSPDENWVAFQTVVTQTQRKMYVAPIADWRAGPESSWIYIPDARAPAAWSPSGNLLYFLSDRDGFRCIWAQHLNPVTRHPEGPAFAVQHLHAARRTLSINLEIASIGLSLTSGKLFFSAPEHTGNVWIADLDGRP